MPLTLVTGPANSGKAEIVMEAVRRHLGAGAEPLLVVPTRADVERYRGELASGGLVLGTRVLGFGAFLEVLVARAQPPGEAAGEPLGEVARERLLATLAARAWPGAAGGRGGTPRALRALIGELEVARISPERLQHSLRSWAAGEQPGAARAAAQRRAGELERVYRQYREALVKLRRPDGELRAMAALDELRRRPSLWGRVPALFYGFDDLTPLQLDAIETLAVAVDAPVTVSLTYERGRVVFAGRAAAFEALRPLAARHVEQPPRAEHYAAGSRAALHHLERSLFEREAPPQRVAAGQAIRLLEGGSERAELELVAGEVRALLEQGVEPGEIAIVHRAPDTVAELMADVLGSFEIPFSLERRLRFSHTGLGGALLSLLACAFGGERTLPEAQAGDLLRWLRAPGVLEVPALADRLEARLRRSGANSAEQARAVWEAERWPLEAIERLRGADREGPRALIDRMAGELERLFYAPRLRRAAVLGSDELDEARAFAAARGALEQLRALARAVPELLGGPPGIVHALSAVEVIAGEPPDESRVAVLAPLALRARRVRALFLCGLQEGIFPAPARPEPLLGEERRRRIRELAGLPLALHDDALAGERYLLYAAVSRPEELLALSWHTESDDGAATSPSLFLADMCELFDERLWQERRHRPLGEASWPGPGEPPAAWAQRERALCGPRRTARALAPLRDEQLLAALRRDRMWSASSLERYLACPVRWFVERVLRPAPLEPDSEPLLGGRVAHETLRELIERLRAQRGSGRLSPESLPAARALLSEVLEERLSEVALSAAPERLPGARRRMELDLGRYLERAAREGSALEPELLEVGFGFEEDGSLPAVELGEGVRLRGRIDRIDAGSGGEALVIDYKRRGCVPQAKWMAEGNLQLALYMHAVERLLGRRLLGGLYQPLSGDLRARGVVADDCAHPLQTVATDVVERAQMEALLGELLELARKAAREADAGALEPRPLTCKVGRNRGCEYPEICRCEP